jgi:hypothetical protein
MNHAQPSAHSGWRSRVLWQNNILHAMDRRASVCVCVCVCVRRRRIVQKGLCCSCRCRSKITNNGCCGRVTKRAFLTRSIRELICQHPAAWWMPNNQRIAHNSSQQKFNLFVLSGMQVVYTTCKATMISISANNLTYLIYLGKVIRDFFQTGYRVGKKVKRVAIFCTIQKFSVFKVSNPRFSKKLISVVVFLKSKIHLLPESFGSYWFKRTQY